MQKKKQTKPIKQIIIITIIAILLLLLILSEDIIKFTNKNKINLAENTPNATAIVDPNIPQLSAGMIPIKWENDHFVITTKDNPYWYDYKNGKPAYIMLNDGYYQSELLRDMTNKELAENNVGVGVPDDPQTQGTILMWIPRFAYNEQNEIKYIKNVETADENWTIPEMFTYRQEDETKPDFLLTGIWFEIDVDNNYTNKIIQMNSENSIYGFIANTIAVSSNQTTGNEIQNYINKLSTDTGTDDQWSPLQSKKVINATNQIYNTNTNVGARIACPQIADITNPNRIILKIINQNNQDPIKAKASYNKDTGLIEVQVTYSQYGIQKILYEDTQELKLTKNGNKVTASTEGINVEAGDRTITIIDKKGNTREILVEVIPAIYVTFYPSDGTLAFASNKNPLPDKGTYTVYEDISKSEWSQYSQNPWYNIRNNITTVTVVDKIQPLSTAFWFYNCANLTQINDMKENLETRNVTNMKRMFYGCSSLTTLDLNSFNTDKVTDMNCMFSGCSDLSNIYLNNFDTTNVTDMGGMFCDCKGLTNLDLSNFDTSNVSVIDSMFCNCRSLTILDLSNLDISNVTDLQDMFYGCSSLTTLNLNNLDTSNVTNAHRMFYNCHNLTQITFGENWNKEVTVPAPNQDEYTCSGWYSDADFTNKVAEAGANYTPNGPITIYAQMVQTIYATLYKDGTLGFASNTNLITGKTKQYGPWNISNQTGTMPWYSYSTNVKTVEFVDKIKPISTAYWFHNCRNLIQVNNIKENLDTSKVATMDSMFSACTSLTSLDLTNFNTSNVTDMQYMFVSCSNLNSLNLASFNTSNVTNMRSMFSGCNNLTSLDLSNFNISSLTNMQYMFSNCSGLTTLDLSSLNASSVTNMSSMFENCSSLTTLDLSNINASSVTDMNRMFTNCSSLTTLDLSNFNISSVTNMQYMFSNCTGLTTLDLSNFDTSNVTDMYGMFDNCSGLTTLDLSSFNTSNVTTMTSMFYSCTSLTTLDLGNFNTNNVINMQYMFAYCSNLKTIYVGANWKLASSRTGMFSNCGTSSTTLKN